MANVYYCYSESGIEWGANHLMMTSPGPDQCEGVMTKVKQSDNIVSIYLWSCSPASSEKVFSSLLDTAVTRLRLYHSEVNMESLASVLTNHLRLQEVWLSSCHIVAFDIKVFCEKALMSQKVKLKILNFSSNANIGDDGAKYLAEYLSETSATLEQLYLQGCNLTDEGVRLIANALKGNGSSQVHTLALSQNRGITDTGAQYIADMVKCNDSLKVLQVEQTTIAESGTKMLCEALDANKRIFKLILPSQMEEFCSKLNISERIRIFF